MDRMTDDKRTRNDASSDTPEPVGDIVAIAKVVQRECPKRFDVVFKAAIEAYITLRTHPR